MECGSNMDEEEAQLDGEDAQSRKEPITQLPPVSPRVPTPAIMSKTDALDVPDAPPPRKTLIDVLKTMLAVDAEETGDNCLVDAEPILQVESVGGVGGGGNSSGLSEAVVEGMLTWLQDEMSRELKAINVKLDNMAFHQHRMHAGDHGRHHGHGHHGHGHHMARARRGSVRVSLRRFGPLLHDGDGLGQDGGFLHGAGGGSGGLRGSAAGSIGVDTNSETRSTSEMESPMRGRNSQEEMSEEELAARPTRSVEPDEETQMQMTTFQTLSRRPRPKQSLTTLLEFQQRMGIANKKGSVRDTLWHFLEETESSVWAQRYATYMQWVIMLSVAFTLMMTTVTDKAAMNVGWFMELAIDLLFFGEIALRWIVGHTWCAFFNDVHNMIDLMAGLALVVRLVAYGFMEEPENDATFTLSFQCFVPIFRLLKMLRRFEKFNLLISAFTIAFEALPVMLYTLLAIMLIFSSIIFIVEPRDNIESLSHSMWLTLVTMTTVGYGDVTPQEPSGKVVVAALVVVSALYMAIPLGIVGSAFSNVWEDRDRLLLVQRTRQRLLQRGYKAKDIPTFFQVYATSMEMDPYGDPDAVFLDIADFRRMINEMRIGLSEERIVQLFQLFDDDGSGTVEPEEFVRVLFPRAHYDIYTARDIDDEEREREAEFVRRSVAMQRMSEGSGGLGLDFDLDKKSE
eukprot:TRINITY_DN34869_c0_g1_i1.p1 TRINITY_DN34869_c0_g1~~TRINITY_DN34869_c0_g1_i1.p1  ORF type:complete len:681 (-),score=191.58 TRINITY_DN34869_c0_g1_i1:207-2249(-)